ncbi:hypothetical protein G7Z17_g5662 [Cylindrodendrum hubeiense]|uniref:Lysophospholipase n=1 Tax=Cylindrodendrum hubeiense TaxID=595255 RepID=A0A9P5H8J5_9HYPO|nr:hypothetical protein G7Z17_g5662 [Cylindrodendrum hubeiense]
MNGAGALSAFDIRTESSVDTGHLGGLLQSATYLSGLSGGSWLVGSLFVHNFTTVESIISSTSGFLSHLWQFDESIIEGPDDLSVIDYYGELHGDVEDKADAGYNTTITDYWGRALSYQLVNATDGGPDNEDFAQARTPMPIIIALERPPGQLQLPENASVYEFNPWEMGSYDPSPQSFAPLRYIGSDFEEGTIAPDDNCIIGADNAGFVMGTSSSLFNAAFLEIDEASGVPGFLTDSIASILEDVGEDNKDIANWPNPFYKQNPRRNLNANSRILTLVDGGEDLQNIPLQPLILPERQVDVIFAIDSSADTSTAWPNGTALVATYERSRSKSSSNYDRFPRIPDQNTFVNLGLNQRPTFFGCTTNTTSVPLIVYVPNAPYTFESNVGTFDLEYSDSERNQIIENGYNVATMGNGTLDSNWPHMGRENQRYVVGQLQSKIVFALITENT